MLAVILEANDPHEKEIITYFRRFENLTVYLQEICHRQTKKKVIFLSGEIDKEQIKKCSSVAKILPISSNYPLLSRLGDHSSNFGFSYKGVDFYQDSLQIFAGLNAVDNEKNVRKVMSLMQSLGLNCTRMGAFKPRTSPHSFQGEEEKCLQYVFSAAKDYEIKVIAMEITSEKQLEMIVSKLQLYNDPPGVMLQVGTRNAQNFELLKALGQQKDFPVLFKRGYGITLEESLNAAEYLAAYGNNKIIFCLRGVKSLFAAEHRNMVDFAQISMLKRLTRLPVCIDPSHAVGTLAGDLDDIPDIFNVCAQGIITGANMLLLDVHPEPLSSPVDDGQILNFEQFSLLLKDINFCRNSYVKRKGIVGAKKNIFAQEEIYS